MTTLAAIGHHRSTSGAGVVHGEISARIDQFLPLGWRVESTPLYEPPLCIPRLVKRGARPRSTGDVVLSTGTPLPLLPPDLPVVSLLYDVRWAWAENRAKATYRSIELRRTLRRSSEILTISNTVAAQLDYISKMRRRISVLPMGPGQFEGWEAAPPTNNQVLLLIGSARHKENELAASLLAASPEVRARYSVIGVSLSDLAAGHLASAFGKRYRDLRSPTRQELAVAMAEASHYVALGRSEGFGLPYIEAAYFGCDVVAPNLPIVREATQGHGNLLSPEQHTPRGLAKALEQWDEHRIISMQATAQSRTWDSAAEGAARALERAFG
jgi:hypothetical protein